MALQNSQKRNSLVFSLDFAFKTLLGLTCFHVHAFMATSQIHETSFYSACTSCKQLGLRVSCTVTAETCASTALVCPKHGVLSLSVLTCIRVVAGSFCWRRSSSFVRSGMRETNIQLNNLIIQQKQILESNVFQRPSPFSGPSRNAHMRAGSHAFQQLHKRRSVTPSSETKCRSHSSWSSSMYRQGPQPFGPYY
ncbi:Hypothetical_protein [Hexamita inflata]|uniref:Hypothetical_protein n=1 Tax=Hexamita inflata TaxID=28002 RepID=A0AA86U084_9EUKA|nr:Hypothetical protein HINF_LOCUS21227 [Hexamita inflata]